jgi:hypothetical protein
MEEKHIPFASSPLDDYRGGSTSRPQTPYPTKKKKPGRKKKPVKPVSIAILESPIVLEFN